MICLTRCFLGLRMNLLTSYTGNVNEFEYVVLNFLVFLAQLDRIGNDDAEYDGQLMLFV